ncbi:putative voltage-gated potassium channel subunit beta [Bidens hawaiensis]|uniref:putative voltage-gated potassium channel subunit beta n=1 Tax=Bidens hawaiensis TaxID=980011 RepID=UPI00404A8A29
MKYKWLGSTGLRVLVVSYGTELTFGWKHVQSKDRAKELLRACRQGGINFLHTGSDQCHGEAERLLGKALEDMRWNSSDVIVTTRISFDLNLLQPDQPFTCYPFAKKFNIETTRESVKRLGLKYVDIIICDFPDYINVEKVVMSVEEIVWAMNRVINEGLALHRGVFEWDIYKIKDACAVAEKLNLIKPILVTIPYSISTRTWV